MAATSWALWSHSTPGRRMVASIEFPAIIDQRFVQTSKTRAWVGGDVFEAQRLEDIDHEVGPGSLRRQHIDVGRIEFLWHHRRCGRLGLNRLWRGPRRGAGDKPRRARSRALQEFTSINGKFFCH